MEPMDPIIFNHTAHKELWGWLVENPDKEKLNWPGWKTNGGKYDKAICDCFACDADEAYDKAHNNGQSTSPCEYCPICANGHESCLGGIYDKWDYAANNKKKSQYAKIIRDLPVRNLPNMIVI